LNLFPEGKVYSFEPDPRAIVRFKKYVQSPRAMLFEIALSDEDGAAEFYMSGGYPDDNWRKSVPEGWDQSGSIRKPANHLKEYPWCTFERSITVETCRLDTWCKRERVSDVDFIWADVQGAEADIIKGGQETLKRTRYFFTEYNDKEMYEGQPSLDTILEMLPDFETMVVYRNDVLLKNKWA